MRTQELTSWRGLVPLLLVGVGLLTFFNSLEGVFMFDDLSAIVQNRHLHRLWPIREALSAPPQTAVNRRPLVSLSLAVNYALGGLAVRGYHIFNMAVHVSSTLLLFGILRRMFLRNGDRVRAPWLAGMIALLWMVHPLTTEAVDYVVQRTELMMGFFLLATVYGVVRGVESVSARRGWFIGAVVACSLGMGCKEVMVVVPLVVLLFDAVFLSSSWREPFVERWRLYAGLAASWLVLGAVTAMSAPTAAVGLEFSDLTPMDYLRTEAGVILHYLRLTFWPQPLVIDYYDWPVVRTWAGFAPQGMVVLALVGIVGWGVWQRKVWGFLGTAFFLVLAPTSTVLPLYHEVAAERRMYVPLIALVTLVVLGVDRALKGVSAQRWGAGFALGVALLLATVTVSRNEDYSSTIAIWADAVVKRPGNARAHNNLGFALASQGEYEAARASYEKAVNLDPNFSDVRYNLAVAFERQGKLAEARVQYERSLQLNPQDAVAYYNLGNLLAGQNHLPEAMEQYTRAIQLQPDYAQAHNNLGGLLLMAEKFDPAIEHFRVALRLDPNLVNARANLALALEAKKKISKP